MQGIEIGRLKARIDEYDKMQKTFRTRFTGMRFYFYTCKSPYDHLTEANKMIDDKEEKIKQLQAQATLFEVAVPNFPLMDKCRKENKMLKSRMGKSDAEKQEGKKLCLKAGWKEEMLKSRREKRR